MISSFSHSALVIIRLTQTVIDTEKWLAAEKALDDALVSVGLKENSAPGWFESFLTSSFKKMNQTVNKIFSKIEK